MRSAYLVLRGLLSGALLFGCGDDGGATAGAGTGGTTGSGTAPDDATTGSTTGATTSGPSCVPGASSACACTNGDPGAQVCEPDGKSYGECTCEGGGTDSESDSNTGPTTGPGTTTGVSATTGDSATIEDSATTGSGTTGEGTDGATTLGETEGIACDDPGAEPNEDEADAVEQDDKMCNAMPGTIEGVLDGDADVDWFTYHTVDTMGCGFANPTSNLVLLADQGVRMCVFVDCDQGDAEFKCPITAMDEASPDGLPGCCTAAGALDFGLNCTASMNESAEFFVRLDAAPADSCVAYNVTYTWGPV